MCQTRCLEYAPSSQRPEAVAFTNSMAAECAEFQSNGWGGSTPNRTTPNSTTGFPDGLNLPSECAEVAAQQMQMFNMLTQQQQESSEEQCSYATLAVNNVDFIAGTSPD